MIFFLTPPLAAHDAALLTDFEGRGRSLRWTSVNDNVMGGRSVGSFRITDGKLVFSGSLNTNGGGFASLRTQARALDLDGAEGLYLRVRGDGREYQMTLRPSRTEARRAVSYRAKFKTIKDTWQDVWLPFRSFAPSWRGRTLDRPPVDPKDVSSIGLMIADKIDGAFQLEVDAIRTFAPFSLKRHRWEHRLLVVFAPRADDPRLQEQVTAVRAAEAGFRERDMALVVVSPPVPDYRPLTATVRSDLREKFGVPADAFAVKLIGKDGEVKHTAVKPVDMASIYALIDTMPMRRAEMAR